MIDFDRKLYVELFLEAQKLRTERLQGPPAPPGVPKEALRGISPRTSSAHDSEQKNQEKSPARLISRFRKNLMQYEPEDTTSDKALKEFLDGKWLPHKRTLNLQNSEPKNTDDEGDQPDLDEAIKFLEGKGPYANELVLSVLDNKPDTTLFDESDPTFRNEGPIILFEEPKKPKKRK